MIDTIIAIAKLALAALPFVILCVLSNRINLAEQERSRQFAMPIIALLYAVAGMLLMETINDWLLWLIYAIPGWIAALANVSWMPETVGGWLTEAAAWLTQFLQSVDLEYWIFFIANTAILLVYLMLKNVCIGLIRGMVKPDGKVYSKIAPVFYRFYFERNAWYLKESYTQVRAFLKTFYYGAVTVSTRDTSVTAYDFRTYNPFRFSSEYADDTLGLVYYNYRYYNPMDGRWFNYDIAEDVLLYTFVRNSPLIYADRLGLLEETYMTEVPEISPDLGVAYSFARNNSCHII